MEAKEIFINFLKNKGLKLTSQREEILNIFLKTEDHFSAEDLYDVIKKRNPSIGYATVFRTLKLLHGAGIARRVDLGDKKARYEHKYGHPHHDHLICENCGMFIEVFDPAIEELQDKLCKKFDFSAKRHRMEIFGVCKKCKLKERGMK